MIYDQVVLVWKNKTIINKKIEMNPSVFFNVSTNSPTIKLKKFYLNTYEIGGDEGCMCYFNINPPMVSFNIENFLLKEGAQLKNTASDYEISCKADVNKYTTTLDISIYEKNQITATFKRYFRTGFPYEYGELDYSDRDQAEKLCFRKTVLALVNNNLLWDLIFKKGSDRRFDNPIELFFSDAIYISKSYLPSKAIKAVEQNEIIRETKNIKFTEDEFTKYLASNFNPNIAIKNNGYSTTDPAIRFISIENYLEKTGEGIIYDSMRTNTLIKFSNAGSSKAIRFRSNEERIESLYFYEDHYFILTTSSESSDEKTFNIYQLTQDFILKKKIIIPKRIVGNNCYNFRGVLSDENKFKAVFFEIENIQENNKHIILLKNIPTFTLNID
ncbi:hypothetical protein [Desulforegula conservatrix]|uniref:hypothetical protein n=1 Tax=Desulforegula conservatrix TaxID=153026 RepID=UPI0012EB4933|nr:hypothetical protein [Desulforegula conservatrix]